VIHREFLFTNTQFPDDALYVSSAEDEYDPYNPVPERSTCQQYIGKSCFLINYFFIYT
jgi:hypothetical protein